MHEVTTHHFTDIMINNQNNIPDKAENQHVTLYLQIYWVTVCITTIEMFKLLTNILHYTLTISFCLEVTSTYFSIITPKGWPHKLFRNRDF